MQAYELRGAGAVLHSHSVHAVAATVLQGEGAPAFTATQLEMIKVQIPSSSAIRGIKLTAYSSQWCQALAQHSSVQGLTGPGKARGFY